MIFASDFLESFSLFCKIHVTQTIHFHIFTFYWLPYFSPELWHPAAYFLVRFSSFCRIRVTLTKSNTKGLCDFFHLHILLATYFPPVFWQSANIPFIHEFLVPFSLLCRTRVTQTTLKRLSPRDFFHSQLFYWLPFFSTDFLPITKVEWHKLRGGSRKSSMCVFLNCHSLWRQSNISWRSGTEIFISAEN